MGYFKSPGQTGDRLFTSKQRSMFENGASKATREWAGESKDFSRVYF